MGFYYCLVHKMTYGKLFLGMSGVFTVYFSCTMSRLMMVFAPFVCMISAIAVSEIIRKSTKSIRYYLTGVDTGSGSSDRSSNKKNDKKKKSAYDYGYGGAGTKK